VEVRAKGHLRCALFASRVPQAWSLPAGLLKNLRIISQRASFRTAHKTFANESAAIFLTVELIDQMADRPSG
jgi:hypothetical protein